MKYLQQNNKLLESIFIKMNQEMKRNIKFVKHKLTQPEIIKLCFNYLKEQISSISHFDNKENISPNINNQNRQDFDKDSQVECSAEKMQSQLNRRYNQFLNKNQSQQNTPLKYTLQQLLNLEQQSPQVHSSQTKQENLIANVPLAFSYTFSQAENTKNNSLNYKNNKSSLNIKRSNALLSTMGQCQVNLQKQSKQKSKTFSRLRKVEEIFCSEKFLRQNSRKKRHHIEHVQDIKNNTDKEAIIQQNKSLKAIQNNLKTHLVLLEKYKHVPSLEEIVQKQEKLKRKESQLKDLEESLMQKELMLNRKHYDSLKKQKSQRIL